ncbi:ABC transporter permease [Goodfellowiella coeruleoviolacea]|uniref:ABC-2 type transport system permease protein n=1 Tax=Goodfellowiella coeruleoviolacea TaxID=334858 RepID=A0AAE3GE56_9PSEU|nr:ABC transporter permease [Goodfellowiella coeruleoviolacea]MCP2165642.1 ABC-2 type transport system permease protein [Goodfellowiella coeruleoviolacea]
MTAPTAANTATDVSAGPGAGVADATGAVVDGRLRAPLGRLLGSELRWMLRRPRTLIALGLLALVPVVMGLAMSLALGVGIGSGDGGPGPGNALIGLLSGNGLVLPVFVLTMALNLLLPLVSSMWAADALAGEASVGTLRGLLLAPVGRVRLLAVKAFGVATVILFAVLLMTLVAVVSGMVFLGGTSLLTLSGTTLPLGSALGRLALAAAWVTVQLWAVAAVALAISACTDHPLVVMAATMAGLITFAVVSSLSSLPALEWVQPYLLSTGWESVVDVMRDPLVTDGLLTSTLKAGCYLVIGLSLALLRVTTRDN